MKQQNKKTSETARAGSLINGDGKSPGTDPLTPTPMSKQEMQEAENLARIRAEEPPDIINETDVDKLVPHEKEDNDITTNGDLKKKTIDDFMEEQGERE